MQSHEFRQLRAQSGLSVRNAAAALGIAPSSVYRYEHDQQAIPAEVAQSIRHLAAEAVPEASVAYALGQAFACAAYVLDDEIPQSIWTAVKARPATAFGEVMRLCHVPSLAPLREQISDELADVLVAIPETRLTDTALSDEAEGRFWLGYYQGRYDLRRGWESASDPGLAS